MTDPVFDLRTLIAPLAPAEFFSAYWERQHLHVSRRESGYYGALVTAADLENLISHSDARYPAIRLAKGGAFFPPEMYTRNVKHGDETFAGVPDVRRITEEYKQGATIALPALHRTWRPLGELCDSLQTELDHAAHANGYITPGNTQGFTPHYDVHEVFVLQIAGTKRWQLFDPVVTLPHRTQLFKPGQFKDQKPMAEIELHAGDLLYLPRGVVHSAATTRDFSAHVTIGITVYTWVDLVKEFLSTAIDTVELRKSLPPGFATRAELRPLLKQRMQDVLTTLGANSDTDRLIDAFTTRVRSAHTATPPLFRADFTVIDLNSQLRPPPPDRYRISLEADRVMLEFKGTRYHMPAPVASTVIAITKLATFRPADLPGPLTLDDVLALSRHLIDIGFLTHIPAN